MTVTQLVRGDAEHSPGNAVAAHSEAQRRSQDRWAAQESRRQSTHLVVSAELVGEHRRVALERGRVACRQRIVEHLDPRHYSVYSYSKPSSREKRHHFLWRFWTKVPGLGGLCIFDRSWYGRLLVERVECFATVEQWTRAYDEIVGFERSMVMEGVILVKFWVQVSPDEQLKRFESRRDDRLRSWKLTDEDWRNRDKSDLYAEAADDMFERTDHDLAPWDLVSGEHKKWARVTILETLNQRVEEGLDRWDKMNTPH